MAPVTTTTTTMSGDAAITVSTLSSPRPPLLTARRRSPSPTHPVPVHVPPRRDNGDSDAATLTTCHGHGTNGEHVSPPSCPPMFTGSQRVHRRRPGGNPYRVYPKNDAATTASTTSTTTRPTDHNDTATTATRTQRRLANWHRRP